MRNNKVINVFFRLISPYRNLPREIYIIFISKIINALGCFVGPLLTLILTKKIGLSTATTGFYMTISGFVFLPASLIGGKIADTLGRKRVIIICEGIAAVLYIACGFMNPSLSMVYTIIAAEMFMVMAGPAHDSMVADLTTPENREGAYALCYMGWNIGFAVGPTIGGLLFEKHLPWVFIGDAITALLALVLVFVGVKETMHIASQEIDDDSRKLEKSEEGSILSVLLKRPILIYFALIMFGYNFVYSQWSFLMPMHVSEVSANGAKYFGTLASFNGLVVMFCTPFITKFLEKTRNTKSMVYGGILYAVGFGMLGFLNSIEFFYVSVFIFTLGEIVLSISASPFIANHTPASHRGRMSSMLGIIMGAGFTFGPLIMGKVLMNITMATAWIGLGIIGAVAAFFMTILEKHDRNSEEESLDNVEEVLNEDEEVC